MTLSRLFAAATVRARMPLLLVLASLAPVHSAAAQSAAVDPVAAAIAALADDTRVTRSATLRDLGFDGPDVLAGMDARREIYLPVPAGIPIRDAALTFDARYMRAMEGNSTLLLSLDGYPVSVRSFSEATGDASARFGVDGAARRSGFLRLGVAWSSQVLEEACQDDRQTGNVLAIGPDTRLTYSFDGRAVGDIATAWSTLPARPVVLVAGRTLDAKSYDAAWRIGVALQRAGKPARFAAFPATGDTVDLANVVVPEALQVIPAYAALAGGGQHRIASDAEAGAMLTLAGTALSADVVVGDAAFASRVNTALDALAAEIATHAPAAAATFGNWRAGPGNSVVSGAAADSIRVAALGPVPVIVIAPEAGAQAAALFENLWHRIVLTRSIVARVVEPPMDDPDVLTMASLGGVPGSINVLATGDWTATFGLGAIARAGRVPAHLDLDVAAAPGATVTAPVASVFLNDVLLGAKMLTADGTPERISARIPGYALAATNVLRVTFQRQPAGVHCREIPQAYPAAVLPSSTVRLGPVPAGDDFVGMIARYAEGADVLVAPSALTDAVASLTRLVAIADAIGIVPDRATLIIAEAGTAPTAGRPFLALDVPVQGLESKVRGEAGRLVLTGRGNRSVVDISGLDRIGVLEVARAGTSAGIAATMIDQDAPNFEAPLRLGIGDVAIVGPQGVLATLDSRARSQPGATQDPATSAWPTWLPADLQPVLPVETSAWLSSGWAVPIATVVILLFVLLLIRAALTRRRARSSSL